MQSSAFKPEILIIDDDSEICETLELIINGLGFFVRYFTNPKQGLEYFEREKNPIVFLDVNMPEVSGLDLLPKIKQIEPKTQVMMMTGEHDIQKVASSVFHRASDFILKPFQTKGVEAALSRALEFHAVLKEKDLREETLNRDLRLAAKIQNKILQNSKLDSLVYGEIIPTHFVSGDFYQISQKNSQEIKIFMGDIEGHGVAPGLISIFLSTVHKEMVRSLDCTPVDVLRRMNQELVQEIGTHSMTGLSISIQTGLRKIEYSRAGFPFPILFKYDRSAPLLLQEASGQILGIVDTCEATASQIPYDKGDILFLYSDGLLASSNHPLVQTLWQSGGTESRIQEMNEKIQEYIQYLKSSSKVTDDISYLLLQL